MNPIDLLIQTAEAEVGYLEKASNSNLDNKTGNAGYNNYTKYARDLDALGYFYNGKKNGYAWCDVFVDWCFVKAFNPEVAMKMLNQPQKSYGAGCGYSANYYKSVGRLFKSPEIGDQIFFGSASNVSHTGIVVDVKNGYVYTIEGNTSGTAGVVANGGGVFKKSYSLNYSKIYGYGRPKWDIVGVVEPKSIQKEKAKEMVTVSVQKLSKGNEGNTVKTLQQLLMVKGFSCGSAGADGDFGNGTYNAVISFQKSKGLVADGVFGKNSWDKLLNS